MSFLSIIFLCHLLILQTISRPLHNLEDYDREGNEKEDSYEDSNKSYSDDFLNNEQKSSLKQFSDNNPNNDVKIHEEDVPNTNGEMESDQQDYLENSDENQAESAQLSHNDIYTSSNDVKRTVGNNNGLIFHNIGKGSKVHTNELNEDNKFDISEHERYFEKSNIMQNKEKDTDLIHVKRFGNLHDALYRHRRQVKESDSKESGVTDEIATQKGEVNTDEDEETAIRRHIKKLSKEEIEELLTSLSEDKRELLKNIIQNTQETDSVNKREVTKKTEESSFFDNEQTDSSKIQEGSANIGSEFSISKTEQPENTKKANSGPMSSENTEVIIGSEKSFDKSILDDSEDTKLVKSDAKDNLEAFTTEATIQSNTESELRTKNGNKREIDSKSFIHPETEVENPKISNSLKTEDLYCSENEDFSQLWSELSSQYQDDSNNNINKREICSDSLNSIKSLEESFPNTGDEGNLKPGSDMVPLVRVKRTNLENPVEKRDAHLISDVKVPFFSNDIDKIEEDNDEGSEFQDDEFFDRTANYVKSAKFNRLDVESATEFENNKNEGRDIQPLNLSGNNEKSDTESLGSDTDAVLSGIEGVDDNLMYNSGSRNKRTENEYIALNNVDKDSVQRAQAMVSENETNDISERSNNIPRYQESDAFGSLPRNYEEDLGRYKRIRRLKPVITTEFNVSNR